MSKRTATLCRSADLIDSGAGLRFVINLNGHDEPAFAVRFGGVVYAYLNRCVHARAELDWNPGQFFDLEGRFLVCSLHGALYAPDSGLCLAGPCAGGTLVPVRVDERDGSVIVEGGPRATATE